MYFHLAILINILVSIVGFVECSCQMSSNNQVTCPQIISRTSWGAQNAVSRRTLRANPPPYVVVHHSDTPSCTTKSACSSRVKNIQYDHMNNRGWDDIGYNFLIGGDGNVYEGRGWGISGAHVKKYNSRSIGICLIGNFQENVPPSIQLEALKNMIQCGVDTGKLQCNVNVIGHRQGGSTDCPGNYLYNEIQTFRWWEPSPS